MYSGTAKYSVLFNGAPPGARIGRGDRTCARDSGLFAIVTGETDSFFGSAAYAPIPPEEP